MKFFKVKTRKVVPPKDSIYDILDKLKLKDKDVLVITSKILGIHQGRGIKISDKVDKRQLVKREADYFMKSAHVSQRKFNLTIIYNTFLASAGIDESNGNGYYVLLPKNVNKLLKEFWRHLRKKNKIKNLGLIATDSQSVPLRRGTLGVAIGFYGFEPQKDYIGKPDIFGRKLKYTKTDIPDALASGANLVMGEGDECTPVCIVRDINVKFTFKPRYRRLVMPIKYDLFFPILRGFKKAK